MSRYCKRRKLAEENPSEYWEEWRKLKIINFDREYDINFIEEKIRMANNEKIRKLPNILPKRCKKTKPMRESEHFTPLEEPLNLKSLAHSKNLSVPQKTESEKFKRKRKKSVMSLKNTTSSTTSTKKEKNPAKRRKLAGELAKKFVGKEANIEPLNDSTQMKKSVEKLNLKCKAEKTENTTVVQSIIEPQKKCPITRVSF